VRRSRKRELISRGYNRILRLGLGARFSDAQCGFKAIRADVARRLLPEVVDQGWFFDTELLILAQRQGLRIHEVAVDWVEDPDSRVDIWQTALDDLRGVARLRLATPVFRFMRRDPLQGRLNLQSGCPNQPGHGSEREVRLDHQAPGDGLDTRRPAPRAGLYLRRRFAPPVPSTTRRSTSSSQWWVRSRR
jgi:hypothetical protein